MVRARYQVLLIGVVVGGVWGLFWRGDLAALPSWPRPWLTERERQFHVRHPAEVMGSVRVARPPSPLLALLEKPLPGDFQTGGTLAEVMPRLGLPYFVDWKGIAEKGVVRETVLSEGLNKRLRGEKLGDALLAIAREISPGREVVFGLETDAPGATLMLGPREKFDRVTSTLIYNVGVADLGGVRDAAGVALLVSQLQAEFPLMRDTPGVRYTDPLKSTTAPTTRRRIPAPLPGWKIPPTRPLRSSGTGKDLYLFVTTSSAGHDDFRMYIEKRIFWRDLPSGMWAAFRKPVMLAGGMGAVAVCIGLLGWWRRRARERGPHACVKCGYDLRATPGRCPECGAVVASDDAAAAVEA